MSELRFNLWASGNLGRAKNAEERDLLKKSSFMARPHHRRQGSSMSSKESQVQPDVGVVPELNRLDLSLGQEHAGGGFGGKQAKLGKLIIEDEGMKMMDLLVAANMALWFRAYYKADKG